MSTNTNGTGTAPEAPAEGSAPALNALAQYTKDFSFENPNAPNSLGPQQNAPQISIQVNVNAKQLAPTDFEVELKLEGGAGEGANTMFKFELTYCAGSAGPCCDDRVPAPAFPVCTPDRGRCRAQRWFPASLY
jgi:hypothetical protein